MKQTHPPARCALPLLLLGAAFLATTRLPAQEGKPITEVAHFDHNQVTGIAVSKTGRLFANFPLWSTDYQYAVVEILPDGTTKPFPNEHWNSWQKKDADVGGKFVCVQSVVVDDTDALWILDPANPMMNGVEPGGPKLVKVDLATNQVVQTIPFDSEICPSKSYLNDVRFDTARNVAYLTESGVGGIVVVDLKSGKARRLLVEDPSTLLEKNVSLTINGKEVKESLTGRKPQFNADGIALSPDNEYLYYQALMGQTLYRVATAKLRDGSLGKEDLGKAVEKVGATFPCDGLWMTKDGNLYLGDLQKNAVKRRTPEGNFEVVCADPRIQWPDSFAQGPDGALYFSCSRIQDMAKYNGGKSPRTEPYTIFKVMP